MAEIYKEKYLDRLTRADEILLKNQQQIDLLVQEQRNTNYLLYNILRRGGVGAGGRAGEILPEPAAQMEYEEYIKQFARPSYTTRLVELRNLRIVGAKDILNVERGGALAEILFLTPFGAVDDDNYIFGVQIVADGKIIYDNLFSEYVTKSDYAVDMTAFSDASYNALIISSVFFQQNLTIRIRNSTAIFTFITAKIIERL